MSDEHSRAVWRVSTPDGIAHENAFDALVVLNDTTGRPRVKRHLGVAVPFEGEMDDVPLTLIVRARPEVGPIIVDYRGFGPDGSVRIGGGVSLPLAVIIRSATGISATGLPDAARN